MDHADGLPPPSRRECGSQPRRKRTRSGEGVAQQPGQHDPGAGLLVSPREDGQHEDQQRIDLHVEPRAEVARNPVAAREPPVDTIQRRREQARRRGAAGDHREARLADQARDECNEHRPPGRDLVRRPEVLERMMPAQETE